MASLFLLKLRAHQALDACAGQVRLRYITDVPGQQAVYMTKLQQAQAYLVARALDADAAVPPYLAAEAGATGESALQVATAITGLATVWNEQLGPAIEGARLGAKRAVSDAQDEAGVQAALSAGLAALDAL